MSDTEKKTNLEKTAPASIAAFAGYDEFLSGWKSRCYFG